ncbi:translation initiation factor IF-5A [Candidatus Hecatella orcuttiae]|jgi:translation initiation factor 5A|uniref:translation initiation factor IF-5A n=1 Tax=Candidatus Hecatella orcuttiae TaxID=1935119 RepID=UPI00286830B8|nr:translation initiation factor IF-5A [Candidatus Hecatella orcuttiae]
MSKPVDVGSIKPGQYMIIDNEPCRVISFEKSKPGKHGSAKARIVAVGLFDNVKRSIVSPVDARAEVPLIDKRSGQVISVGSESFQLMDLETYEVFETALPAEEELRSSLTVGAEVEYWKIMNRIKITRVKS